MLLAGAGAEVLEGLMSELRDQTGLTAPQQNFFFPFNANNSEREKAQQGGMKCCLGKPALPF